MAAPAKPRLGTDNSGPEAEIPVEKDIQMGINSRGLSRRSDEKRDEDSSSKRQRISKKEEEKGEEGNVE